MKNRILTILAICGFAMLSLAYVTINANAAQDTTPSLEATSKTEPAGGFLMTEAY